MPPDIQIWEFVRAADFKVPLPPVSDAARGGMFRVRRLLRDVFQRSRRETAKEKDNWFGPTLHLLDSASPSIDWSPAAAALAAELGEDWFGQQTPAFPQRAIVGPPGCDVGEIVRRLAKGRRLRVLSEPSPTKLLDDANEDVWSIGDDESGREIVAIPQLERWYLRHEDGLNVIRRLLDRLLQKRARAVIGCDSWAWAFLQLALGIEDILGEPLALASFDAERLDAWLRVGLDFSEVELRESGSDEPLFRESPTSSESTGTPPVCKPTTPICSLAAKARGNPAVARDLWRASLRTQEADATSARSRGASTPSVLWLVSPAELDLPELPVCADELQAFILHAVLLHGGLSLTSLIAILPFPREAIQRQVAALLRQAVLDGREQELRVAGAAYPGVRAELRNRGFLTDAF